MKRSTTSAVKRPDWSQGARRSTFVTLYGNRKDYVHGGIPQERLFADVVEAETARSRRRRRVQCASRPCSRGRQGALTGLTMMPTPKLLAADMPSGPSHEPAWTPSTPTAFESPPSGLTTAASESADAPW